MNIDQKIYDLESQVELIQAELEALKRYIQTNNEPTVTDIPVTNEQRKDVSQPSSPPRQYEVPPTVSVSPPTQPSSSSNLEKMFGKYFMGIAASILIFISLILFGILVYRNFTDTLKMITIYGISTVVLASGFFMLHKQRNAFSLSLTGCGMGTFYTCFIVTYTYFRRINDITLYSMLFIWAIAVILIAKKYHAIVISVIGQIGILIASLFGLAAATDSNSSFLLLVIFTVISTSLFVLSENNQTMQHFLILSDTFLMFLIGLVRIFSCPETALMPGNIATILLLMYSLFLYLFLMSKLSKPTVESILLNLISTFFLIISSIEMIFTLQTGTIVSTEFKSIILLIWLFGWWIVACYFKQGRTAHISNFILFFSFMLSIYHLSVPYLYEHIGLSLFFLPLLLFGTWKKDMMYKIGSYVVIGMQLICIGDCLDNYILTILILGFTLLLAGVFLLVETAQYNMKLKLTHYFYLIAYFVITCNKLYDSDYFTNMNHMTLSIIFLFAASITTVLMLYFGWCNNFNTGEEEPLMYSILRKMLQIFLIYGICLCYSGAISVQTHFILILWLTFLCLYGCKDFIKAKGIQVGSVILAVKYTAYILLIMHSFTIHMQTATSIVCLLIAITCILLGFHFKAKHLRFYGLALTMIAIAKLLLIDINYTDSIARIISFLVCGLLCFLINFIYSFVMKKYDAE